MKFIGSIVTLLLINLSAWAQTEVSTNLEPKEGVTLEYEINASGQSIPLILKVSQIGPDGVTLDYNIMGSMTGKFINSKTNLEKGTSMNWDQPIPGEERKLPDDQTIAMVSRTFLKDLKTNKKATYDNNEFQLKEQPQGSAVTVGGKEVKSIYAESSDGAIRIWVLDNNDYPFLVKLEGNAGGINLTLKDVR